MNTDPVEVPIAGPSAVDLAVRKVKDAIYACERAYGDHVSARVALTSADGDLFYASMNNARAHVYGNPREVNETFGLCVALEAVRTARTAVYERTYAEYDALSADLDAHIKTLCDLQWPTTPEGVYDGDAVPNPDRGE